MRNAKTDAADGNDDERDLQEQCRRQRHNGQKCGGKACDLKNIEPASDPQRGRAGA